MTAELRNLPHIASMAFNEPLMLEPAYARVFFCALAGQLGISRLTDAVSGDSLTAGEAPEHARFLVFFLERLRWTDYAKAHHCHRRPSERRKVDAVQ